jgi:hypothetical protein
MAMKKAVEKYVRPMRKSPLGKIEQSQEESTHLQPRARQRFKIVLGLIVAVLVGVAAAVIPNGNAAPPLTTSGQTRWPMFNAGWTKCAVAITSLMTPSVLT